MDALAGYGSDDSSSSDTSEVVTLQPQQQPKETPEPTPTGISPTTHGQSSNKRARIEVLHVLQPRTSSTSICQWPVNYLEKTIAPRLQGSLEQRAPTMQQIQESLQRVSANASPSTPWADHLRTQHDFHNPHFFASVVEHFGIQDMMGTCCQISGEDTEEFAVYQQGLFPKCSEESVATATATSTTTCLDE